MNSNHQILEAPQSAMLTTNVRRQALWQTSLVFTFAISLLGALLLMTSRQSPVEIATPRESKPDISWVTTRSNTDGQVLTSVSTVNGVEPEATFMLSRTTVVYNPDVPTTATVHGTAFVHVNFKDSVPGRAVSISADGPGYSNYALATFNGGVGFVLTPYIVVKDVNTATPLQFNTQGYTLSDNKVDWLGGVEITSHKNSGTPVFPTPIQRGQPLSVRWISNVTGADGAEVSIVGYGNIQTTTQPNGITTTSYSQPITVTKPIAPQGVNEMNFSAEDLNKFPNATRLNIQVRYFKAKTANSGKAVLVSNSVGVVEAFLR